ncbi:helix-turn-helix domain-containing protein [Nonomuraea sp. NPDC049269]|uniref:helix-turn-helix domain-containing protein n=1 Tax=Nonomuraea sp. NPDC049269 TaxID=3364349 RepID=UPI00371D5ECA
MRQVVRTENLPRADRFEFWRETLAQVAMPVDVLSTHSADFVATIQTASFGAIETIVMRQPPIDVERTRRLIRQSDPEVYQLVLNLAGHQQFAQERREAVLRPGEMMLYHSSSPFRTRSGVRDGRESAVVVTIPPAMLHLPARKLKDLLAVPLSRREDGLGPLVSRYLLTLASSTAGYSATDATQLSFVTLDLISIMLASRLDAETSLSMETREQVLFARIQSFIHQRLGDSTLSPETIASAHHVSVRSLHRLFRAHGMTVSGSIRSRRLDRCRRDLTDPLLRGQSISTIAARWAFPSNATFGRAFKAVYGMSPGDYRQRVM